MISSDFHPKRDIAKSGMETGNQQFQGNLTVKFVARTFWRYRPILLSVIGMTGNDQKTVIVGYNYCPSLRCLSGAAM